jgi:hypothetical protein
MWFTQLLHTGQVALCAYGAYVSFIAIRNLQQYEETSKKAAKYSFEAERQLHKTRTTQSSGAICVSDWLLEHKWLNLCTDRLISQILASMIAATTLSLVPNSLPSYVRFGISPAALVLTLFVRAHVSNFWKAKAKIPFVQGYVRCFLLRYLVNEDADDLAERGNLKDWRALAGSRVPRVYLGWNCAC